MTILKCLVFQSFRLNSQAFSDQPAVDFLASPIGRNSETTQGRRQLLFLFQARCCLGSIGRPYVSAVTALYPQFYHVLSLYEITKNTKHMFETHMKNNEKATNVFLESPLQFPQPNKLMVVRHPQRSSNNSARPLGLHGTSEKKMLSVAEIEKPWLKNQWSINV